MVQRVFDSEFLLVEVVGFGIGSVNFVAAAVDFVGIEIRLDHFDI